jgi:hypothetical protein
MLYKQIETSFNEYVYAKIGDNHIACVFYEEFEDSKGVIRIRKPKKNKQHNGQKKKDKQ